MRISTSISVLATVLALHGCGTATDAEEQEGSGSNLRAEDEALAGQGAPAPGDTTEDDSEVQPSEDPANGGKDDLEPSGPQVDDGANLEPGDDTDPNAQPPVGDGDDGKPADGDSLTGTFTGYIENYQLATGSDTFTVTFDTLDTSSVTGSIVFGEGPAVAAPHPSSVLQPGSLYFVNPRQIYVAYAYTLEQTSFDGQRLRFGIVPEKIWGEYCASMPPIADEVNAGNYACMPNWGFSADGAEEPNKCYLTNPGTGMNEELDCAQYHFCNQVTGVCRCTESVCGTETIPTVTFDVVVDGDAMHGSVAGILDVLNVHLERE